MSYRPVVEVTRGEVVESIHYGAIVVAEAGGSVAHSWGDIEIPVYLRSCAKPFQALPGVEAGVVERYGLSRAQLAVMCASHSGTDEHVDTVRAIHAAVGLSQDDLQCGSHMPFDRTAAEKLRQSGDEPSPLHHNCSGKHSGMLALAKYLGEPLDTYISPDHPVQRRIVHALSEMGGIAVSRIRLGVDGCSAPNFALPLRAAATAFARLAAPADFPEPRRRACHKIFEAMTEEPRMVSGPGKFDTRVMEVTGGRLLAKGGAEGCQAFALPAGVAGDNSPALGVMIKIADGDKSQRAGYPVAVELLRLLGALREEELVQLEAFAAQPVTNHRGGVVGEVRPAFQLASRMSSSS